MIRFGRLTFVIFAMLCCLGLPARPARADSGPVFTLAPVTYDPALPQTQSYFVLNTEPGATIHSQVRVINTGSVGGTARLYPVDGATGQTSGIVFLNREDPRQSAGAWLDPPLQTLVLDPGESRVAEFSVRIPADAQAGQHVAGLAVEDASPAQGGPGAADGQKAGFSVTVLSRAVVAVQVNLPGPAVEQLEARSITPAGGAGYQQLLLKLQNDGNTMLKPSGSLQVTDGKGRTLQSLTLKLDTLLPQTSIDYPVAVQNQAVGAGDYHAALTLDYGQGKELRANLPLHISSAAAAQVFQAPKPLAPAGAQGTSVVARALDSAILLSLFGAVLLGLAVTGFLLDRRNRKWIG